MTLFSDREAHGMWSAQLLDMAAEKMEAGDQAAARELQRQAKVHQREAALRRGRQVDEGRSL